MLGQIVKYRIFNNASITASDQGIFPAIVTRDNGDGSFNLTAFLAHGPQNVRDVAEGPEMGQWQR